MQTEAVIFYAINILHNVQKNTFGLGFSNFMWTKVKNYSLGRHNGNNCINKKYILL